MVEPAYLAGVWDSDGSFTYYKHSRKNAPHGYDYLMRLQLTWQITPESKFIIQQIQNQYGGYVMLERGKYLRYTIGAKAGAKLIADMLPFLRLKKRQAELCYKLAMAAKPGRKKTSQEWKELEIAHIEVMGLNHKGGNYIYREVSI